MDKIEGDNPKTGAGNDENDSTKESEVGEAMVRVKAKKENDELTKRLQKLALERSRRVLQ